jgi:bifunctional non-homologous end joining protein LigD
MKEFPIFVIQKHSASHIHYDFRLEKDGVLKSWAIPKEPVNDVTIKRLAVEVEDHQLDYSEFEGEIPEGNYGAGKVEIWDKGDYEPEKYEDNEIIFNLKGEKLNGRFCLIRFKKNNLDGKNWLFFKTAGKKDGKK